MTNQQVGKLKKYKAQQERINRYLELSLGLLNYKREYHSSEHSTMSYYRVQKAKENLEVMEEILKSEGISIYTLKKMVRILALGLKGKRSKTPIDFLSETFICEFYETIKGNARELLVPTCGIPPKEFIDKLVEFKSLKRRRAIKGLPQPLQAKAAMRNLRNIYVLLKPNIPIEQWMHSVIDQLTKDKDNTYMPKLISDCRKINPLFVI